MYILILHSSDNPDTFQFFPTLISAQRSIATFRQISIEPDSDLLSYTLLGPLPCAQTGDF